MRRVISMMAVCLLLLYCAGCKRPAYPGDSTEEARLDFLLALEAGDYETFLEQLANNDEVLSEDEFFEMRKKISDTNTVQEIQLMRFDNGEMYLMEFVKNASDDSVKIQKIIPVEGNGKEFFNQECGVE